MIVIDNYDSFTYNLVHYIEDIMKKKIVVMRNDEIDNNLISESEHIIISPGPGLPEESGDLMEFIENFHKSKKILGVCLGHQAIGEFFGGKLLNSEVVHHGVSSMIEVTTEDILYKDLSRNQEVGRYHSWYLDDRNFPSDLQITSRDMDGTIMSLKHKSYPLYGVQFHPESVLSNFGKKMIENFIIHS